MRKSVVIYATCFLMILLASCAPNQIMDQAQSVTPFPSVTISPIATPAPTLPPTPVTFEFSSAEEQAELFLSSKGDLETSLLTPKERADFSSALVEKINADRGVYPATFKDEAYLDYASFRMKNLTDGSSPSQQTFPLFFPVSVDEEGYLEVRNTDGSWATIAGSRGIDWSMVVSSPDDPRIDWPLPMVNKDNHCGGRGGPDQFLAPQLEIPENAGSQIPVVLLEKNIGQIFLEGESPRFFSFLRFLTVTTDSAGNPVYARNSIVTWFRYCLMEEGSDADYFNDVAMQNPKMLDDYLGNPANKDLIALWETIGTNHVYHLGLVMDQEYVITVKKSNTDRWKGLAPLKDAYAILAGEVENDQD